MEGREHFSRGEDEEKRREVGREQHIRFVQETHTFPKTIDWVSREKLTIASFCNQRRINSEVLEVCAICWNQARWVVVLLGRKWRVEDQEWTVDNMVSVSPGLHW